MKRVGFVDYYLSEWHANNYPVWFSEINEQTGTDYKVAYAWAELGVSPNDSITTDEWCANFGAERCDTLDELCEKSDVIVILAPTNPEKHLEYARTVLPYGKRTYIDKTFAPSTSEAEEIFAVAKKYGTQFFSTSALRYGSELDECEGCRQIAVTGSGASADEYIIHQVEMVVKKLGVGAEAVCADRVGDITNFRVRYPDGRIATMTYAKRSMPFTVYMIGDGKPVWRQIKSEYFKALMADILRFFEDGSVSFDTEETLEAMRIREAVLSAAEALGKWIEI